MYRFAEKRLARMINAGTDQYLKGGRIGLEKESLRVSPEGTIAQTPHPEVLGSPLTNQFVTTDYSEALIEFIAPPCAGPVAALAFLGDIQKYVYDNLRDEILWSTSMPCVIRGETSIPIAQYGSSNAGKMKMIYRRGLGYRYGRAMQVIAGVHFNYSFPENLWSAVQEMESNRDPLQDFRSTAYMGLIRNLQRFGWLVPYLFGASPAVCKSFLGGQPTTLQEFSENTYYEPFATSLRMGDIGYQNNKEKETGIKADYDSLTTYLDSLLAATSTPYSGYDEIGVVVDGEYRQLNANLLQIENEYYSTIRPKQTLQGEERPITALRRRGVEYVELRSLDVNAFDPLGIDEQQVRFLEAFLTFCLLEDSPPLTARERSEIDFNEITTAHRGREPGLRLQRNGREYSLRDWALELCDAMEGVCDVLDRGEDERPYASSLAWHREMVRDPDRTPSARMISEMRATGEEFFAFARRMSEKHNRDFRGAPLDPDRRRLLEQEAIDSRDRTRAMEADEHVSFEEYLGRYFAQS